MIEYDQPTPALVPKMKAVATTSGVIAAIVTLLTLVGVTIPNGLDQQANVAVGAVIVIISFVQAVAPVAAGYFKKDAKPAEAVKIIKSSGDLKG